MEQLQGPNLAFEDGQESVVILDVSLERVDDLLVVCESDGLTARYDLEDVERRAAGRL